LSRAVSAEKGVREWTFARPSMSWTRRLVSPEETLEPAPGKFSPVRVETVRRSGKVLPGGWTGRFERRETYEERVPYYRWRIFYTAGDVPRRFVLRADPETGEFPPLPKKVAKAREEGKLRLAESTLDRQVYVAIPEGYFDVEAPSAFEAINRVESNPEWKEDYHFLKAYEWSSSPSIFVPREVEFGYDACLPVARTFLNDTDASVSCAISSWNASGVEPSREMVHAFTGVPDQTFRSSMRRLEEEGRISCENPPGSHRWGAEVCSFTGEPVGARRKLSEYQRGLLDASKFLFRGRRVSRVSDLSPEQVSDLEYLMDSGVPYRSISKNLGFGTHVISELKRGRFEEAPPD